jgi:hypothetical protein
LHAVLKNLLAHLEELEVSLGVVDVSPGVQLLGYIEA